MSVPKASVNEKGHAPGRKHEVRLTGQPLVVENVAEAGGVKMPAD